VYDAARMQSRQRRSHLLQRAAHKLRARYNEEYPTGKKRNQAKP
jgi:hypothetical protein